MGRLRGLREPVRHAVRLRCPRCGQGRLFRGPLKPRHNCSECHLRFEREPGYFLGAIYVNYAVTVVLALAGYFVTGRYTGLSASAQIALWGAFALVFPLWFFRYSRSLWLALDFFVDPSGMEEGR